MRHFKRKVTPLPRSIPVGTLFGRDPILKEIVQKVAHGQHVTRTEADRVVRLINQGEANDLQIAALISSHLTKGTNGKELAAWARAIRTHAERIAPVVDGPLIDTCGTGGGQSTFNISTAAAIVAAAADIPVAKQGVRSIWSLAGGADVLEALGVEIKLRPESVEQLISEVGIGFIYAPLYHSVLRKMFIIEQSIGIKSLFHTLIVPLTNPAGVRRQLLGVGERSLVDTMAEAVVELGFDHVLIVHGEEGLDEISVSGPTHVVEIKGQDVNRYQIRPEDFGLTRAPISEIKTDEPSANAQVLRDVLSGREQGAKRQAVLLNAAGALMVGGRVRDLGEGVRLAAELIDDGWAEIKMHELVEVSKRLPTL